MLATDSMLAHYACMNSKQTKTLAAIYELPTLGTIVWSEVESLLMSLGCEKKEGKGSGVKFKKNGITLYVHRPHPKKEAKHYQIDDTREFLTKLGVKP